MPSTQSTTKSGGGRGGEHDERQARRASARAIGASYLLVPGAGVTGVTGVAGVAGGNDELRAEHGDPEDHGHARALRAASGKVSFGRLSEPSPNHVFLRLAEPRLQLRLLCGEAPSVGTMRRGGLRRVVFGAPGPRLAELLDALDSAAVSATRAGSHAWFGRELSDDLVEDLYDGCLTRGRSAGRRIQVVASMMVEDRLGSLDAQLGVPAHWPGALLDLRLELLGLLFMSGNRFQWTWRVLEAAPRPPLQPPPPPPPPPAAPPATAPAAPPAAPPATPGAAPQQRKKPHRAAAAAAPAAPAAPGAPAANAANAANAVSTTSAGGGAPAGGRRQDSDHPLLFMLDDDDEGGDCSPEDDDRSEQQQQQQPQDQDQDQERESEDGAEHDEEEDSEDGEDSDDGYVGPSAEDRELMRKQLLAQLQRLEGAERACVARVRRMIGSLQASAGGGDELSLLGDLQHEVDAMLAQCAADRPRGAVL